MPSPVCPAGHKWTYPSGGEARRTYPAVAQWKSIGLIGPDSRRFESGPQVCKEVQLSVIDFYYWPFGWTLLRVSSPPLARSTKKHGRTIGKGGHRRGPEASRCYGLPYYTSGFL